MFRLLFRIAGWLALAGSFVAIVIDGTKSIAADEIKLTGFGQLLAQSLGERFAAIQPAVERNITPFLWDPVLVQMFRVPAFAVLALLGVLLVLATARRRKRIGYSSRP